MRGTPEEVERLRTLFAAYIQQAPDVLPPGAGEGTP